MSMTIPIGSVPYELTMQDGWLELDGRRVHGYCDRDNCRIEISGAAPPAKRYKTAMHEIGHALVEELDIHNDREFHGEEALCNIVGLAFASFDVRLMVRVRVYMLTGIPADDVMLLSGCSSPVPVLRVDDR